MSSKIKNNVTSKLNNMASAKGSKKLTDAGGKKRIKAPSTFAVLFFAVLLVMFMTWMMPGTHLLTVQEVVDQAVKGANANAIDISAWYTGGELDYTKAWSSIINAVNNNNGMLNGWNVQQFIDNWYASTYTGGVVIDWKSFDGTETSKAIVAMPELWKQQGIMEFATSIGQGFISSASVIALVFMVTIFVNVMMKKGSFATGVGALQQKLKGKEIITVPLFFFFFSFMAAFVGFSSEPLAFLPLFVPFFILVGYDALTAFIVVAIGNRFGWIAPVTNPYSVAIPLDNLVAAGIDINMGVNMMGRIFYWIALTGVGMGGATWYAARVKKSKDNSWCAEQYDEDQKWAKKNLVMTHTKLTGKDWAAFAVFFITVIVMIVGVFPGYPPMGANAGPQPEGLSYLTANSGNWALGKWGIIQFTALFFFGIIALKFVFKIRMEEFTKIIVGGVQSAVPAIIVVALARSITVILNDAMIGNTIAITLANGLGAGGMGLSGPMYAIMAIPIFMILGTLIPSSSGLAGIAMPIFGPAAYAIGDTGGEDGHKAGMANVVGTMMAYTQGLNSISLIAPTSGVHIAMAEASNLSYSKAFKTNMVALGAATGMGVVFIPLITALAAM